MVETDRKILTEVTKEELENLLDGNYTKKKLLKELTTMELLDELVRKSEDLQTQNSFNNITQCYTKVIKGTIKEGNVLITLNILAEER